MEELKYSLDLLKKAGLLDSKPCATPVVRGKRLSISDGDLLPNPTEYRSLVGGLQYLTLTRPDLQYAVNYVCQFILNPTALRLQAVRRILRLGRMS
ncbi:uncharacterized protein M6B38_158815 [Iris pallida]|uniref:Reverse transcriptase n=1 Tax=Iris pallida TaxID=29817 RepID=A0AAX6F2A6_IRIPA|nr:uncharacterized protein M6B38_158815 [Iris pallida]